MSRFRNNMGYQLLEALFYERVNSDKSSVVYTLKREDHEGFPSLYRLYMETADPTEYRFAITYLDGWDHWERLTQCSWFKPYVEAWRKELEVKIRAESLARIIETARGKSGNAYYADKYLLDGSWKPAGASGKGRPTKDAIRQEAHRIASEAVTVASDFERVLGTEKVN